MLTPLTLWRELFTDSVGPPLIQEIDAMREAGLAASIAYFYHDFRADQTDLRQLLSSMLAQLFHQSEAYFDVLSDLYSAHHRGSQDPNDNALTQRPLHVAPQTYLLTSELQEYLLRMLQLPGQTYIVIDALDECPATSGLLSPREGALVIVEELVELQQPNFVRYTGQLTSRVDLAPLSPRSPASQKITHLNLPSIPDRRIRGEPEDSGNEIPLQFGVSKYDWIAKLQRRVDDLVAQRKSFSSNLDRRLFVAKEREPDGSGGFSNKMTRTGRLLGSRNSDDKSFCLSLLTAEEPELYSSGGFFSKIDPPLPHRRIFDLSNHRWCPSSRLELIPPSPLILDFSVRATQSTLVPQRRWKILGIVTGRGNP